MKIFYKFYKKVHSVISMTSLNLNLVPSHSPQHLRHLWTVLSITLEDSSIELNVNDLIQRCLNVNFLLNYLAINY